MIDFIKKTLFTCIKTPRLRLIETRHYIEIKRVRELCEQDIEKKSKIKKKVVFWPRTKSQ